MSQWRELNPWPLPYQGSALPLSYIGSSIKKERETRFELATLSLEGWCSTNWATPAKWTTNVIHKNKSLKKQRKFIVQRYWLKVGRAGFEPTKAKPSDLQSDLVDRLSISPKILLCKELKADGGTRTHDLLITNQLL